MAPKRLNFSDSEAAQLDSDVRTMLLYTEHSGKESSIYRFSGGPQKSTHAFGLLESDVGRNSAAREFLRGIGFTEAEIGELSGQGALSHRENLNTKLRNHKKNVDHFVDHQIQGYIDHLDRLISYLDRWNPAAADAVRNDHQLQLALLDYHNQLRIDGLGETEPPPNSLLSYLIGRPVELSRGTLQRDPKATLSRNDIQNYINHSRTGVNQPKETERRAEDLDKALGILTPSQNHLPRSVPAGKNPPGPYEIPSRASPFSAFSYLDLARRPNALGPPPPTWDPGAPPTGPNSATPNAYLGLAGRPNALGPIPPMWDPGALPTGQNRLASDSPMNLPPVWANPPFQYSPNGVRGPVPSGQTAPASLGYSTWPLPSDSPPFPRRNLLEPAGSVSPWGQPQPGRDRSPAPSPRNVFGPWPGTPLEGAPDLPQGGSRNGFGPWSGSDLPGRRNLLDPDIERLLGLYLGAYAPSGQAWPPE